MKQWTKRGLCFLLALITLLSCLTLSAGAESGQTVQWVKITKNPTTVDTFKGVPAKYVTYSSNTGTYCCAKYVSNFYKKTYGVTVSNLLTGRTPKVSNSGYKVKKVSAPKVGDIYYQKNSSGSGHWAVVKKVTKVKSGVYKVQLIEQNWKWNGKGAKNRTIRTDTYGKKYGVKFFRVYNKKGKSVN